MRIEQERYRRYVLGEDGGRYVAPDSAADRHESLQGAWKLVQRVPRSVWLPDEDREAIRRPPPYRKISPGSMLHRSVLERMQVRDYRPASLGGRSLADLERDFLFEPGDHAGSTATAAPKPVVADAEA